MKLDEIIIVFWNDFIIFVLGIMMIEKVGIKRFYDVF